MKHISHGGAVITYDETDYLPGEAVTYTRMRGKGVRGDPFIEDRVSGTVVKSWRTRIGPADRFTGLRQMLVAVRIDGGALLIASARAVHHVKPKPRRSHTVWNAVRVMDDGLPDGAA